MPLHLLIYLISCSTVSTFFHDLICLAARLIQKMALHNRRCQTDRRVEHHESSGRESLCFQESWFFCRPQAAHFVEDFKLTTPGAEWAAYPPNLWQVDLGVTYYQVSPCHSSKINVLALSVFLVCSWVSNNLIEMLTTINKTTYVSNVLVSWCAYAHIIYIYIILYSILLCSIILSIILYYIILYYIMYIYICMYTLFYIHRCVFLICLARQNPQVPLFAAAFYGTGGPCGKGSRRCRWRGWITYCGWLGNPASKVVISDLFHPQTWNTNGFARKRIYQLWCFLIYVDNQKRQNNTEKNIYIYIYTVVFHEKMVVELANISSLCLGPGKWSHFVFWRAS